MKLLKTEVSESFKRNKEFFTTYADNIYIISNGFREFIEPVVTEFGIKPENILANDFTYDSHGKITGFDKENPLNPTNRRISIIVMNKKTEDAVVKDGGVLPVKDGEGVKTGLAVKTS